MRGGRGRRFARYGPAAAAAAFWALRAFLRFFHIQKKPLRSENPFGNRFGVVRVRPLRYVGGEVSLLLGLCEIPSDDDGANPLDLVSVTDLTGFRFGISGNVLWFFHHVEQPSPRLPYTRAAATAAQLAPPCQPLP